MPISSNTFSERRKLLQRKMAETGFDLAIVTPGPNLRYLTDFRAHAMERITALVLTIDEAWMLVPQLEFNAAQEFFKDFEVVAWGELDNPYEMIFNRSKRSSTILLDQNMKFLHVEKFHSARPSSALANLAQIIQPMRAIKSQAELAELRKVSSSINKVHQKIATLRFQGKTERVLAREIHELILEDHETVDFVIVASGANSANPHHQPAERIIEFNDVVIIDIGGTSSAGYCSDCTRTYHVGEDVNKDFLNAYQKLQKSQLLGVQSVNIAMAAEDLDRVVREELAKDELSQWFIHRLGHGIGVETHEDPYLVSGNKYQLRVGNAFSIEPGFYIPDRWGARIEDIVAISDNGVINLNEFDHDLRIVH
jgi:Xaa-Pro aminopeptidase